MTAAGAPQLVDAAALTAYVGDRLPGDGPLEVEHLAAGHSNLTYVVRRQSAGGAAREWILRRPPRGPLLPTAHDVIREFRVLDLLARSGAGVPVPEVVLSCADSSVIGAPFYVMERVHGTVVRERLPAWLAGDEHAADRRRTGEELIDALIALHAAPVEPFVEAGIGKPAGYLTRQLQRWQGQREGAKTRELPDYDILVDWLEAHRPESGGPAVVHGDYKLDNVAMTSTSAGPRLAAILDWEMATVGDPLADLGYLMSFWLEPGETSEFEDVAGNVTSQGGFPTRAEMVQRYAEGSGRDVTDLTFYTALAIWKLAILLEGSYSRHLAGTTDDPFFALLDRGVPALLRRAREVASA
ncbi:MAG TPA: phosphotransferase family protein [Mycobacteriales bacterium]|nr:phosphotransferase family protein [Mycobacteriales bacterium]